MSTSALFETITAKITTAIETGKLNGATRWHDLAMTPWNAVTGRTYRGLNRLVLSIIANEQGYRVPTWATFKQWLELGYPVQKGEKATTAVFWKRLGENNGERDDGADPPRFVARAYHVFNGDQVTGYTPPSTPVLPDSERLELAEAFFGGLDLKVVHEGSEAFYRPSTDTIHLPPFQVFRDADAYYATRAHETVHATGAAHRLGRDLTGRFGEEAYAMEELIAELGSAFLCGALQIAPEPRPDHAPYIASWLKVLKRDSRAIFTAAAKAQEAVDWLEEASGGGRHVEGQGALDGTMLESAA